MTTTTDLEAARWRLAEAVESLREPCNEVHYVRYREGPPILDSGGWLAQHKVVGCAETEDCNGYTPRTDTDSTLAAIRAMGGRARMVSTYTPQWAIQFDWGVFLGGGRHRQRGAATGVRPGTGSARKRVMRVDAKPIWKIAYFVFHINESYKQFWCRHSGFQMNQGFGYTWRECVDCGVLIEVAEVSLTYPTKRKGTASTSISTLRALDAALTAQS